MDVRDIMSRRVISVGRAEPASAAVRLLHRGEGWTQDEVDGEAGRIRAESGEAGE